VLAAGTRDRRTSTMLYAEPDREHETGQTKPECKDRCEQWNRVGKTGRQKWTPKNRRLKSEAETSEKKTGLSPAHKSCSRPRKNQNQIGWKTNAQATWWQQKNTRLKAMLAQIWENQKEENGQHKMRSKPWIFNRRSTGITTLNQRGRRTASLIWLLKTQV
jgi:hypothetical protein